jgi:hypothetical protein
MGRKRGVTMMVAAGLLWGLSEIFVGDVFYRFHIPMRASSLTALGLALLVLARRAYDRPGSSLAAALMAGGLRCLVPRLYFCHLVAIGLEGCAFDISWTALRAGQRDSLRRAWLSSALAAYTGFLAFGLVGAYAFGLGRWVQAGLGGIAAWTLRSGSLAAALLIGLVPVAVWASRHLTGQPRPVEQEGVTAH